jgi:hypothetical protein
MLGDSFSRVNSANSENADMATPLNNSEQRNLPAKNQN